MARERRNAPPLGGGRKRERGVSPGERVRRRLVAEPDLELSDEDLRALADEGIDPEDVRRLAREQPEEQEASIHDRDTPRDAIEGMLLSDED
jgi:hypothetical protein